MSSEWSKDQVLQSYLNIIYFGRGAYGIGRRVEGLLRQARRAAHRRRGRAARRADPAAVGTRPRRRPRRPRPSGGTGCSTAWSTIGALSPARPCGAGVPADGAAGSGAARRTRRPGPNGLIERQVTKELLDLFNINEQTLNTEGLQVTTTIDPKAQTAAEDAVVGVHGRAGPRHAHGGGVDRPEDRRRSRRTTAARTPTASTSPRPGCPPDRRSRCSRSSRRSQQGIGPGLPGGQLAGDRQRHQDHQRRG